VLVRDADRVSLLLLFVVACGGAEPGACDGFADRTLGITGQEYRPCATEILHGLDSLRPRLQSLVAGDAAAGEDARAHYRPLRARIEATGIMGDYRSMRSSTVIMKWPESSIRAFNSAAFDATLQYGAVLAYPNDDNLGQGMRAHEEARRAYGQIR
jgi:hypothetical protein